MMRRYRGMSQLVIKKTQEQVEYEGERCKTDIRIVMQILCVPTNILFVIDWISVWTSRKLLSSTQYLATR